jgi:hypothetical protein
VIDQVTTLLPLDDVKPWSYITSMSWSIEYTAEFEAWWMMLTGEEQVSVRAGVKLLEEKGPALPRPYADTMSKYSKYPNMKELRVQHGGDPIRVMFAFDPRQTAILLIGGAKTGKGWTQKMVAQADGIYERYLAEIKKEGLI